MPALSGTRLGEHAIGRWQSEDIAFIRATAPVAVRPAVRFPLGGWHPVVDCATAIAA